MVHCSRQSIAARTLSRDNNVALMRKYTKLLGMKCPVLCAVCLALWPDTHGYLSLGLDSTSWPTGTAVKANSI